MLVAGEGPPDNCAGVPTSSKDILTTGNAELSLTETPYIIDTAFLNSTSVHLGL